ncbi:MAG: hypothetical protein LBT74_03775 [Acidobacteriota bacterium]|jgi:hypothetical protein|nr:hypothetical protein [Acidobacteriota bacterium]
MGTSWEPLKSSQARRDAASGVFRGSILAALLLAALAAGCGGGSGSGAGNGSGGGSTPPTTPSTPSDPSTPSTPSDPSDPATPDAPAAVSEARLTPAVVSYGGQVDIVATARVSGAGAAAVELLRIGGDGSAAVAGVLRDDGQGGDEAAGDGVYTLRLAGVTVTAALRYQVAVGDVRSEPLLVSVLDAPTPRPATPGAEDADGDGLRDDVRWHIADALPSSGKGRAALQQVAMAYQDALDAGEGGEAEAAARQLRATECLYHVLGDDAPAQAKGLAAVVLSSAGDAEAAARLRRLLGGLVLRQGVGGVRAERCDFDPDAMGD